MRNKHYKIKGIRMSEDNWKLLKRIRLRSGKTWNKFLLDIINRHERNNK